MKSGERKNVDKKKLGVVLSLSLSSLSRCSFLADARPTVGKFYRPFFFDCLNAPFSLAKRGVGLESGGVEAGAWRNRLFFLRANNRQWRASNWHVFF